MNIYVGNLNYDLTEDQLEQLFAEFGDVESVKIITDRDTGRAKGFGFIIMENDEEATKAINELNGKDLQGRALRVNEARPQNR